MKKILITGASGFIGSFIVEEALRRGLETWAAVRPTSSLRYLQDARVHLLTLDLQDPVRLMEQLRPHRFDYIVHAAGATKCQDPADFFRVNRDGTHHLFQAIRALAEAEAYPGPSIVICYCPCLEQHIKAGMGTSQDEMKKAVECGYWHLYRYDPRRIAEGKNPFQLDSKEPDTSKVMDFLMGENRFASLKNNFPDKADTLYAKEVEDVKARYAKYKKLAEG